VFIQFLSGYFPYDLFLLSKLELNYFILYLRILLLFVDPSAVLGNLPDLLKFIYDILGYLQLYFADVFVLNIFDCVSNEGFIDAFAQ